MSTPVLVQDFYARIWNAGDETATAALLTGSFSFRGSLGTATQGHSGFLAYVRSVRASLASYHCEVIACVAEGEHAFARMQFSGTHVATFRGYPPSGKAVHWAGAALFTFHNGLIADLWVLGDIAGLEAVLHANSVS
jgi:steroid delta-isomerase-like uncharacterized protein